MKHTWKYWVNGKYYFFKTWKVYWAYRWSVAEGIDKNGVLDGTDRTCTKIIYTNYSNRYK